MSLTLIGLCFFLISACNADLGSDVNAGEIWQTRDEMEKITNMLDHLTKKVACQGEALETKTEEVAWLQEKVNLLEGQLEHQGRLIQEGLF